MIHSTNNRNLLFFLQEKMNELDSLRQEAETLKNAIRVSIAICVHTHTFQ